MGRLIDCQMAFVTWGERAKFRQGKVGLLRKDSTVYLAIFFTRTEYYKLTIAPKAVELLPAAIRFRDIHKDLFIRQVFEGERYKDMVRAIRVLLRRDELRRTGRGDKLDSFIAKIPQLNSIRLEERTPVRRTAKLSAPTGSSSSGCPNLDATAAAAASQDVIMGYGNELVEPRQPCGEHNGYNKNTNYMEQAEVHLDHCYPSENQLKRLQNPYLISIKQIGVHDLSENLWLHSLSQLQLIDCNLKDVPKQLENMSRSLEYLDLSRNSINKLPRTFCCKMNRLKYLNLSHNQMEILPLEIKFFSRLVELNISNNQLRLLPTTFSDLRRLRTLNVSSNKLSQMPAFKKDDIRLEVLDISCNPFDGARQNQFSTFEVFPCYDGQLGYEETSYSPQAATAAGELNRNKVPKLFEIALLKVVRDDRLFKQASEESLPATIVSTIQRDIFKCYRCNQMNLLPAYNSTDYLEYVHQVTTLITTQNFCHGMTFMKLLCRNCFGNMGM